MKSNIIADDAILDRRVLVCASNFKVTVCINRCLNYNAACENQLICIAIVKSVKSERIPCFGGMDINRLQ